MPFSRLQDKLRCVLQRFDFGCRVICSLKEEGPTGPDRQKAEIYCISGAEEKEEEERQPVIFYPCHDNISLGINSKKIT